MFAGKLSLCKVFLGVCSVAVLFFESITYASQCYKEDTFKKLQYVVIVEQIRQSPSEFEQYISWKVVGNILNYLLFYYAVIFYFQTESMYYNHMCE